MEMSDLIEAIAEECGIPASEIKPESSLRADLGQDSLELVSLMMEIERQSGANIPTSIDSFVTVQDVYGYIKEQQCESKNC